MSAEGFPPVFDGHNDTILSLERTGRSFFERSDEGHIDLPRAKEGGLIGGFFAVFVIDPRMTEAIAEAQASGKDSEQAIKDLFEDLKDPSNWPDPLPLDYSQETALRLLGKLFRIERESEGQVKIVRSAAELEQCIQDGTFAIELHIEGAEPLDPSGYALDLFHAAGLRSVGLTHSRRNIFTEGVPFAFPATPDTGEGLNDLGKELVRQLNKKKMLIDLSHITDQGFWDVAALTDAPLVATHSNAWELCKAPRNLTDRQLDAISESNGVAGLNFHAGFLREDGEFNADMPISRMADHVEYMVERMGIDCVAMGSDFDGAIMPRELKDVAGLPKLMQEIRDRGYSDDDLTKLAYKNWVRVLRDTWGE